MTTVDQQTRRRLMRTGVTALDPTLACPGYVLFNTQGGEVIRLLSVDGKLAHEWHLPYPPHYGYLLPNGNLFALVKARGETGPMFPRWPIFQYGMLLEMDWEGKIVWEHRDPYQHHDGRRTPSGGAIYLTVERIPDAVAARVQGGVPDRRPGSMWADVIVEVDSGGRRIWEWHAAEHLDPTLDQLHVGNPGHEWTHGNTIVPLDDDRVLVSFRNISVVAIIEKSNGAIAWRLGDEVISQQHDANMLPNGNVLIFDNGAIRRFGASSYSRVIEVNPATNDVMWAYEDDPPLNFFSPNISGARRLPNGNTLITEGRFGRMFQVTPDKRVVWEYVNPEFTHSDDELVGESNAIFRATHYEATDLPAQVG